MYVNDVYMGRDTDDESKMRLVTQASHISPPYPPTHPPNV